jgi:hypothetical protein
VGMLKNLQNFVQKKWRTISTQAQFRELFFLRNLYNFC